MIQKVLAFTTALSVCALTALPAAATGDVTRGEHVFATCAACHSAEAGENKFGPSLFGVVGRPSASVDGYSYSTALLALKLTWTPANIDKFIANPAAMAPGTKMSINVSSAQDRADVIAYLSTLQ